MNQQCACTIPGKVIKHTCSVPPIIEFLRPCVEKLKIVNEDGKWQILFPVHLAPMFRDYPELSQQFSELRVEDISIGEVETYAQSILEEAHAEYNRKLLENFANRSPHVTCFVLMSAEFRKALDECYKQLYTPALQAACEDWKCCLPA